MAERGGFEPPVQFNPYNGLANRCFQPLSHLSALDYQCFAKADPTASVWTLPVGSKSKQSQTQKSTNIPNLVLLHELAIYCGGVKPGKQFESPLVHGVAFAKYGICRSRRRSSSLAYRSPNVAAFFFIQAVKRVFPVGGVFT